LARSAVAGVQPRFAREKHFPKGWKACLAEFLELFHRYAYIYKPLSGGSWSSATENWRLSDTEIIKAISGAHDKFFIGTRAGKKTRYAVLDIDTKSKYHNPVKLKKLLEVLSVAGLKRSSLYRSSFSEGWHLYIFFDEEVNSTELRRYVVRLLSLNGFEVGKGTLEVFPHPGQGSNGMGLRLPLQQGWAWLDKETLEADYERYELSATKSLELFLDALQADANSFDDYRCLKRCVQELEARKEIVSSVVASKSKSENNVVPFRRNEVALASSEYNVLVSSIFGHFPAGMIAENWHKGRLFHLQGLSGPSQRAEAIHCLNHYLFYGDPSRDLPAMGYGYEQERSWAITQFLEARHNGQSEDINRGRADALEQVGRAANWRPVHKRDMEPAKYSAKRPISWIRENANRKSDARKRIADALAGLKKQRRSFTTVELQEAAACSRTTLYKHADLWRRDYEDLADGFFETCTHEYNAVEGAASPESLPPSTGQEKITPPGLLAARRVAYELSMRSKRELRKAQIAVARSSEDAEKEWRVKVAALTKAGPSELDLPELKSVLFVLTNYLSLAPYEEDASLLHPYVRELRRELESRESGFPRAKLSSRPDRLASAQQ
jgi:hypothetical protein